MILKGPEVIAGELGLDHLQADSPLCVFDELHKYQHWRDCLKGFFDQYEDRSHALVTGSASLEIFKRGGDSLMGRYFSYPLHPVSVAGCIGKQATGLINPEPSPMDSEKWNALWNRLGYALAKLCEAQGEFARQSKLYW